jgi:Mg-chelatase subunit ChlD
MDRRPDMKAAALALLVCLLLPGIGVAQSDKTGVLIQLDSPEAGATVRGRTDMAPLAGLATADGARPARFDVILVIDVSGSTEYPSGVDVDGDGEIGETQASLMAVLPDTKNTDPDDSVLAAEIQAANALLGGLDARRVRVGVVSFSGEVDPSTGRRRSEDQEDAILDQPLTADFAAVRRALAAVMLRGSSGGTNMHAGLALATRELAGLSGARSQSDSRAKQVILLLTDGKPSLPVGLANQEDPGDIEAVIGAASVAKMAGILINSYGLGPVAIDYPIAATEMARVTGGVYTPVRRPGDIVSLLSGVTFANVEDVVALNLTLREAAGPNDIELLPDGSFSGFVPVRPGLNRIRISALASDGTRGSTEVEFVFKHQDLTDAELGAELERIRRRNRELELLMERKRQAEFRKRERERLLEIEVEEGGETR